MKNIVVCIGNGLLSEAIIKMLKNSGEFKPFRVLIQKKSNIANDCEALSADILFFGCVLCFRHDYGDTVKRSKASKGKNSFV